MKHLIRRFLESIGIVIISSFPASLLILMGMVTANNFMYFVVFGLSAAIFYILNIGVLRKSLIQSEQSWKYFLTNGIVCLVIMVISAAARQLASVNLYTAFFGFTKFLDRINGVNFIASWAVFWVIYIIEIIYFPIERIFVMKRADKIEFMELDE